MGMVTFIHRISYTDSQSRCRYSCASLCKTLAPATSTYAPIALHPRMKVRMPSNTDQVGSNPQFTTLPRGLGLLAIVVCTLVALSGLGGALASMLTQSPTWFLFGFELVTLVAGSVGVLIGSGRFAAGPGLGFLCIAGAVGVGALLGYYGAGQSLHGQSLLPFLLARTVAAAAIAAIGAVAVLARRPRLSIPILLRAIGFMIALVLFGLGAWAARTRFAAMDVTVQAIVGLIAFVLVLWFLAAAIHLSVRAFQTGNADYLCDTDPR